MGNAPSSAQPQGSGQPPVLQQLDALLQHMQQQMQQSNQRGQPQQQQNAAALLQDLSSLMEQVQLSSQLGPDAWHCQAGSTVHANLYRKRLLLAP